MPIAERVTTVAEPGLSCPGGAPRRRERPVPALSWLLILLGACGGPPAPSPVSLSPSCRLIAGTAPAETLTVGVSEPVDLAHAPVPRTEAERLVFAPLFETLLRIDCDGRILPGLAQRWSRVEGDGRRWRLTLRDDARFWDGAPVTAEDIASAWAADRTLPAESVSATDQRTLTVVLRQPDSLGLRWLADPRLAISRASAGAPPLGTGPYAIASWTAGHVEARGVGDPARVLTFRLAPGTDPRDLLDQGADAVITDDPAALAYARSQDAFEVAPLPWAWTYVLAGPLAGLAGAAELATQIAPEAVRGDVRPAEPPFWWTAAPRCAGSQDRAQSFPTGARRRVAYPAGDPVARDIAGRLVGLAAASRAFPGVGPLAAVAQDADTGSEWGYILAIPRQSYRSCLEAPAGAVVPLLDARSSVVARRGRVSVDVEWDGTPRLVRP